jgi:hypothetical protein
MFGRDDVVDRQIAIHTYFENDGLSSALFNGVENSHSRTRSTRSLRWV